MHGLLQYREKHIGVVISASFRLLGKPLKVTSKSPRWVAIAKFQRQ